MPPLSPQDLICPPMSLGEYVKNVYRQNPLPVSKLVLGQVQPDQFLKDLFCVLSAIGGLEPLSATRPNATDLKQIYDQTIEVPPATLASDGKTIVPGEGKLIEICAGNQPLVVDKLRVTPSNLTAVQSGQIAFKRLAVMGFSEEFCAAGEPGNGSDNGVFQSVEHIMLCPEAGFDVHARNYDLFSPALFTIHAEMWGTC
ncbi:MAG TPA: hypothetical protein VEN81_01900 [Planctomycetota bacterium]|nr:hypothetical protein [Planctomycetota bacterium]